jgi:hypothetical protein
MCRIWQLMTAAVLLVPISVHDVTAQTSADVWRQFAERVSVGTELNVQLIDGRRVRATLIGTRDDAVLLQPKTRIPVAVQAVPYEAIVRIEPRRAGHGSARSLAIGVATGVGVFFGIMAIMVAALGD